MEVSKRATAELVLYGEFQTLYLTVLSYARIPEGR